MNLIKKSILTICMLTLITMNISTALADDNGQGTPFFGIQSNPNVNENILNGPDEQAAGQQNQGWDGGTGEVVPAQDNSNIPDVPDPTPVDINN